MESLNELFVKLFYQFPQGLRKSAANLRVAGS